MSLVVNARPESLSLPSLQAMHTPPPFHVGDPRRSAVGPPEGAPGGVGGRKPGPVGIPCIE